MAKVHDEAKELRKLWSGFWSARVVITANNLRVFDHLGPARTAAETAGMLETDGRGTEILLDALTGLGLLKKSAGKYRNAPLANRFLVKGSPYYMGDIIRHADTLWQNWSQLDETVRSGRPARRAHDHEAFIRGMHDLARFRAREVIRAIGLKGVGRALDLGGGPGTYSMEMAKRGVSATLFDLPETVRIARELVREAGVEDVAFAGGDFLVDDIGSGYDLVFISQVLHAYPEEENVRLLAKARAALNPGGRVVIQEFYIDGSRTFPAQSALFAVNMLVNTEGGRCYAPEEMRRWLARAGFRESGERVLEENVLVTGAI